MTDLINVNSLDEKTIFNALSSPDHRIRDFINKEINIMAFDISEVEILDKNSGEVKKCMRSVIIDTEGKSYVAVSIGIANALSNLVKVYGTSIFPEGLKIMPILISNGEKNITSFKLV